MERLRAGWWLRRGQRALHAGEIEAARESFRRAVAARPAWAAADLWLATAESELGDVEGARTALERLLARPADSAVAGLWLGRVLIDAARFDEAREVLESAVSSDPRNVHLPGYLALARWAGDGDAAVLDDLSWELPTGGEQLHGRWLFWIERRFPGGPGTEACATPGPPRTPWQRLSLRRSERLVVRAASALTAGEHERALALLDRADALWPADERAQELRVEAHRGAAEARLERLGKHEHDVDLRLDAAEDLLEIGSTRDALRTLGPAAEHIRSIDPHKLSWRAGEALLRGRALLGVDEPAEAAECFSVACELWPTEVEPRYYLGVAWLRAGRLAEGRRAFIDACAIDAELARERLRELRGVTAGSG